MPEQENTVTFAGKTVKPSKIICIGRNYAAHAAELGNEVPDEMIVFIKPNSAITNRLTACRLEPVHFEGEICFLVQNGRFAAVAFGLDLTKRELQDKLRSKGLPWERSKAFDGSALFSPFTPVDHISDGGLTLELKINNTTVQRDSVSSMIFKPETIITELKTFLTLYDGDIVMTGTPQGVGPIKCGDIFRGSITKNTTLLTSAEWTAC